MFHDPTDAPPLFFTGPLVNGYCLRPLATFMQVRISLALSCMVYHE